MTARRSVIFWYVRDCVLLVLDADVSSIEEEVI